MSLVKSYLNMTPESAWQNETIAMLASLDHLQEVSPQVAAGILGELTDQRRSLKLIASENYSTLSCQLAMGNWLTDKYAEGVPNHRFYAGCEHVDAVESLAQRRARELFGCEFAFVQPHSGADANLLAIWAVLIQRVQTPFLAKLDKKLDDLTEREHEVLRKELGDQCLMGMALSAGGHLTHGYRHNITSKMLRAVSYGVHPKSHLLDYAAIREIAHQERPLILMAGYSAYTRCIDFARLRDIADEVDATLIVDMAHFAGLVAGKVFTGPHNPVPFADLVTSTTHKTLRGPRGGILLCKQEYKAVVEKACPLVMGGPLPHVMAAKAIALEAALQPDFVEYAHQITFNARALADGLMRKGAQIITGGTDNHQVLVDTSSYNLNGRQAELALKAAGIVCNRNTIPSDPMGPWYTSGMRLGTPALTTLGMHQEQMQQIAICIDAVLKHTRSGGRRSSQSVTDSSVLADVREQVQLLCEEFPLYPELPLEQVAFASPVASASSY